MAIMLNAQNRAMGPSKRKNERLTVCVMKYPMCQFILTYAA